MRMNIPRATSTTPSRNTGVNKFCVRCAGQNAESRYDDDKDSPEKWANVESTSYAAPSHRSIVWI